METQIQGENAAPRDYTEDAGSIVAKLEAEAKAQRTAATIPQPPVVPATNAATETPTQQNGNQPVAQAPAPNKPDSLQQFRDKEGNVDPQKIEKANEHLQKSIDDKDARLQKLLNTNKDLMQKHTKVSQEVKSAEQRMPEGFAGLSPELRQKVLEVSAKDPVEALFLVSEMVAERKDAALRRDFEGERAERRDRTLARELDDIGQNGNPWVYSPEGAALFDQAFADRPWLLQSKSPYKDALRFIAAPVAQQAEAAPSARSTPTLGGGRAVPPPSSAPTETPGQKLASLKVAFAQAVQERDSVEMNRIGLEIKRMGERSLPPQRVF